MCGIVGYAGTRPALPVLLSALRDLEYRGYDSAGVAVLVLDGDGCDSIAVRKREGKIRNLEDALTAEPLADAGVGIGHTRWATHGEPSDCNAHPHMSCDGGLAVIHNGIVENYAELREELAAAGHSFSSATDTETIAHLIEDEMRGGSELLEALRRTAARLQGSQAIVAMSRAEPGRLVAARIGNAGGIVVGHGDGEMVVASDLAAVLPHTSRVVFLADGQLAAIDTQGARFIDVSGTELALPIQEIAIDRASAMKGTYEHYMLKEIMEQPEALSDTIQSLVTLDPPGVHLDDAAELAPRLGAVRRVVLLGMGTSLHAAMLGARYFEAFAAVPAAAENASEFRYRQPVLSGDTLVVSVSQSGETVDVLEAMKVASAAGAIQITICNTEGAQTTRVADGAVYTRAGLERGVASTKCFTTAAAALYALALGVGEARGVLTRDELRARAVELAKLPAVAGEVLARSEGYRIAAKHLDGAEHLLFLGRGLAFPAAMEGALKMKEISYIHAEGYAAGEMKHGPIALIDPNFPTVAVAPKFALREKLVSNVQQLRARGGPVIALATDGDEELRGLADTVLEIPPVPEFLEPIVACLPLQLLAYYAALARGCDVDQPRNLAKTVTVE